MCLLSSSWECREAHQPGGITPLQAFAFVSHALPVQQGPCRRSASTASKPDVHMLKVLCGPIATHIQCCMQGESSLAATQEACRVAKQIRKSCSGRRSL